MLLVVLAVLSQTLLLRVEVVVMMMLFNLSSLDLGKSIWVIGVIWYVLLIGRLVIGRRLLWLLWLLRVSSRMLGGI
jgi:hypothetical protein